MKETGNYRDIKKLSLFGIIVTTGIVFGNLGTSPLYVMRAIMNGATAESFNELLIYGGLSCIFWTLTLITTVKYVIIVLKADNDGEGGMFALFAIMKNKSTWAAVLTMIGGAALLADGVITPSITVTSALEGLRIINPQIHIVPLALFIIAALFFIQQFGPGLTGKLFGPVMLIWFTLLGVLGISQILTHPFILEAVNPAYAIKFLAEYPGGFFLLGAVFLCATGAEVLYAELGRFGRSNIRTAWIFVKVSILLNYFGQGAWLVLNAGSGADLNPFYGMMPHWFVIPAIILATMAALIASQVIINGSFTLISEAVSLNFWPRIKIVHHTWIWDQVYIPLINWVLLIACTIIVSVYQRSENMTAAYVQAITIIQIITTLLLSYYLLQKGVNHRLIILMFLVYLTIEGAFFISNLHRFTSGGWVTLLLASLFFLVLFGWYFGRKIKNRYITFAHLNKYTEMFRDLATDESVPKTATNLVYIIRANKKDQVESKVIYSIFQKQPKRADKYWLIHVDRVNDPNQLVYQVTQIIPDILIRIDFHIGFKVEPKINLYFREVIEDLTGSGEIKLESGYDSLRKYNIPGDFKFILIERIMPRDFKLSHFENFILTLHYLAGKLNITDIVSFQLDATNTTTEQVPILINQPAHQRIKRMDLEDKH